MSLLIYALCWLAFAVIHSILARQLIQLKLEVFLGCYYRLTYNLLAAIKIIAVLYIGRILLSDTRFHLLESTAAVVATVSVQLVGIMVLAVALAAYDIGRFSGITQIVNKERVSTSFNEPLQRRLLNKWVRHPLYTGALLVLWGGAVSSFGLCTALPGTLYLWIGTSFEERKLRNIYADEYRRYQQEVPRYFPALVVFKSRQR